MSRKEEEICKNINLYYEIAESLKYEILHLKDVTEEERFDILMPIVSKIKHTADLIMEKYVIFLKEKNNSSREDVSRILNDFLEYISVYKSKLYDLYNNK